MGKKDKRIKGCPDPGCERHVEHYKYKADDQFCTLCGARLVYVCAKCFEEIEDSEDQRRKRKKKSRRKRRRRSLQKRKKKSRRKRRRRRLPARVRRLLPGVLLS